MQKYLTSPIGRLRLIALFEGISLLILMLVAMPMKYVYDDPSLVRSVGMAHGVLFIIFVFSTIQVSSDYKWKFNDTTWKVILGGFIPFGTFWVDSKILKPISNDVLKK
jgi:integral membrane protein